MYAWNYLQYVDCLRVSVSASVYEGGVIFVLLQWEKAEGYEACPSPVLPGYGGHVPGSRDQYGAYGGRASSPIKTREEYQATSPRCQPLDGCPSPNGVGAFPGHDTPIVTSESYTSYINIKSR